MGGIWSIHAFYDFNNGFVSHSIFAESSSGHFDNTSHYVYDYKADYTGTIICAVLCGVSIIIGIINLVLSSKYGKSISGLTSSIKINSQYSAFINQGYDKKEAYKLTLEWLDRQANIAL